MRKSYISVFIIALFALSAESAEISASLTSGDEATWATSSIWEVDGTSAGRLPSSGDNVIITTSDDGSGNYATITAVAGNNSWGIDGSLTLNGPTYLKFTSSNQSDWGNITLNSGSALEVNTNNWANFRLLNSSGQTVDFVVEKGASFSLTGANFLPNGSHNNATNSIANVDIKGNFSVNSACVLLAEGTDSVTNFNVYGSATVSSYTKPDSSDGGFTFGNGYVCTSNMSFKMQDVRLNAILGQSAETIALVDTNSIAFRGSVDANFIIDFANFSIDGGSFVEGQTYSFALISASSGLDESIFDKFAITNEDGLGGEWALADDYLSISDNTLYLNLSRVPEPSTYAAIFALIALAFALKKRWA